MPGVPLAIWGGGFQSAVIRRYGFVLSATSKAFCTFFGFCQTKYNKQTLRIQGEIGTSKIESRIQARPSAKRKAALSDGFSFWWGIRDLNSVTITL